MEALQAQIVHVLAGLPAWLITLIISATPIIELRGAIPIATTILNMSIELAFLLGIVGSVLPIFPILLGLDLATKFAHKIPAFAKFLDWLFARTRAKSQQIEKYEFWGLVLFIGVPLPGTGVWTGTLAAYLFGLSRLKTFIAGILGTTMAAFIMVLLIILGRWGLKTAGV